MNRFRDSVFHCARWPELPSILPTMKKYSSGQPGRAAKWFFLDWKQKKWTPWWRSKHFRDYAFWTMMSKEGVTSLDFLRRRHPGATQLWYPSAIDYNCECCY